MFDHIKGTTGTNVSALVSGILDDIQRLFRQEVALARGELKQAVSRVKTATVSFGASIACLFFGAIMLCHMAALLLHEATVSGVRMSDGIPLWGAYGILAGLFLVIGSVLFLVGRRNAAKVDVIPRQTVETVKENVKWIKNP